jgi:hypothetical protein
VSVFVAFFVRPSMVVDSKKIIVFFSLLAQYLLAFLKELKMMKNARIWPIINKADMTLI